MILFKTFLPLKLLEGRDSCQGFVDRDSRMPMAARPWEAARGNGGCAVPTGAGVWEARRNEGMRVSKPFPHIAMVPEGGQRTHVRMVVNHLLTEG